MGATTPQRQVISVYSYKPWRKMIFFSAFVGRNFDSPSSTRLLKLFRVKREIREKRGVGIIHILSCLCSLKRKRSVPQKCNKMRCYTCLRNTTCTEMTRRGRSLLQYFYFLGQKDIASFACSETRVASHCRPLLSITQIFGNDKCFKNIGPR